MNNKDIALFLSGLFIMVGHMIFILKENNFYHPLFSLCGILFGMIIISLSLKDAKKRVVTQ